MASNGRGPRDNGLNLLVKLPKRDILGFGGGAGGDGERGWKEVVGRRRLGGWWWI